MLWRTFVAPTACRSFAAAAASLNVGSSPGLRQTSSSLCLCVKWQPPSTGPEEVSHGANANSEWREMFPFVFIQRHSSSFLSSTPFLPPACPAFLIHPFATFPPPLSLHCSIALPLFFVPAASPGDIRQTPVSPAALSQHTHTKNHTHTRLWCRACLKTHRSISLYTESCGRPRCV